MGPLDEVEVCGDCDDDDDDFDVCVVLPAFCDDMSSDIDFGYGSTEEVEENNDDDNTSGGSGGGETPTPDPPKPEKPIVAKVPPEYRQTVDQITDKLGDKLGKIIDKIEILNGIAGNGNIAGFGLSINGLTDDSDLKIYVPTGLSDTQEKLILFHEFAHLEYINESRESGNLRDFAIDNPKLMDLYNQSQDPYGRYDLNDAQHKYMGYESSDYEQRLRETFPGENEKFYEYGKWGGGMYNSDEFKNLPQNERILISNYLSNRGL